MSSRDSVRSKKVKRKTIKVRRDRMFGMSSRKSNFFRLKNISDKRNLGKINLEKVLEDGPREIKRLPYSLKLKAKLLSISEVKNDPLLSKEIQEKIDYFITPYNKLVNLKRHLDYEEDFHNELSPARKRLTKQDDERYSQFISDKLWSKITHLIFKNKENFDFQMGLITKILSFKGIINEGDLSRCESEENASQTSERRSSLKKLKVTKKPKLSPKKPKYPTRLMHRYKKEIRQKRNSVVVRDRARSRPKSNMEVAHVVNGQDLRKEERGDETNGFGTVMSVKNCKDRKKRDKRKKFSNFYYRRSMEDPMPKLSFKKNDSAICLINKDKPGHNKNYLENSRIRLRSNSDCTMRTPEYKIKPNSAQGLLKNLRKKLEIGKLWVNKK
ncbi:unnamed protein product [Moneuplotes crassus]|uniref:Uncharacterized protein n=1 Tax=Euplotes crassus TaxID=5936 RepID=A0AAD1U984_EUPCR|nr:unnamed protein product [Moneuplotes crassus]